MPPKWPPVEVISTPFYLDNLKNYARLFASINDVHKGIIWTLEREPLSGSEVPGMHGHRVMKTYPVSPHVDYYILFKYDEANNKVYLLSISSTGAII